MEVDELPDFVLFSQLCVLSVTQSFSHQISIEIPLSVTYDTMYCVGNKDGRDADANL